MWKCSAYTKSVTIYPDGIAPCCIIKSYRKPLSQLPNRDVFSDLMTGVPPEQCSECVLAESRNLPSYREYYNKYSTPDNALQFIDIRNSNLCNLKCRMCDAQSSSQWSKEQNKTITINYSGKLDSYYDIIMASSVTDFYFTGGEPLLISDHWNIIEGLIAKGLSKNISLRYNTNLTTLKYKDKNIFDLWKNFKNVHIACSLDATGKRFNYIRSDGNWEEVENNLIKLTQFKNKNMTLSVSYTVNILNIWNLKDDMLYFHSRGIPVNISILNNPDVLSLSCVPDELKHLALTQLDQCGDMLENNVIISLKNLIEENRTKHLFKSTLSHILYLDKIRNEKLFDYMPFKDIAYNLLVLNP